TSTREIARAELREIKHQPRARRKDDRCGTEAHALIGEALQEERGKQAG
ncbi:unnamed protein product, partial [marine sediment metagenome]